MKENSGGSTEYGALTSPPPPRGGGALPPSGKCAGAPGAPFLDNSFPRGVREGPSCLFQEERVFNQDYVRGRTLSTSVGAAPLAASPGAAVFRGRTFSKSRGAPPPRPPPRENRPGGRSVPALPTGPREKRLFAARLERSRRGLPATASASDGAGGREVPQKTPKSDSYRAGVGPTSECGSRLNISWPRPQKVLEKAVTSETRRTPPGGPGGPRFSPGSGGPGPTPAAPPEGPLR